MTEPAAPRDVQAALQAWRSQGADRVDPLRFRLIEALSRRAAAHAGAARQLLDARLCSLLDDYGARVASRAAGPTAAPARGPSAGPLASLLREFAPGPAAEVPASPPGSRDPAPTGLKSVSRFRSTWARLGAEQRLAEAQALVPGNAGPLNTQHLVHRTLALMHEASPETLNRFVAYAQALMWLDEATGAGVRRRG